MNNYFYKGLILFSSQVLADADCEYATKSYILVEPQHFSPDPKIRDACTEAEKKFRAFEVEKRYKNWHMLY